jgi:hypothetical protein
MFSPGCKHLLPKFTVARLAFSVLFICILSFAFVYVDGFDEERHGKNFFVSPSNIILLQNDIDDGYIRFSGAADHNICFVLPVYDYSSGHANDIVADIHQNDMDLSQGIQSRSANIFKVGRAFAS